MAEGKLIEKLGRKWLLRYKETEHNREQSHGTGESTTGAGDHQETRDVRSQDPREKGNTGK